MNQHKLTKFTIEEKQDIQERYGEWMKPENIVWVEVEYENSLASLTGLLGSEGYIAITKKLESLDWLSGYAEKMWVLEKLKDFQMHTSPYIESRIGEYPIENFNDETKQRILLEEIENGGLTGQGFLSDFINDRIAPDEKRIDLFLESQAGVAFVDRQNRYGRYQKYSTLYDKA